MANLSLKAFSIRDVLATTALCALACGWWVDHSRLVDRYRQLELRLYSVELDHQSELMDLMVKDIRRRKLEVMRIAEQEKRPHPSGINYLVLPKGSINYLVLPRTRKTLTSPSPAIP